MYDVVVLRPDQLASPAVLKVLRWSEKEQRGCHTGCGCGNGAEDFVGFVDSCALWPRGMGFGCGVGGAGVRGGDRERFLV